MHAIHQLSANRSVDPVDGLYPVQENVGLKQSPSLTMAARNVMANVMATSRGQG